MRAEHTYFVYIVASRSRNVYIGVTNALLKRVEDHQRGRIPGYTATYRVHRLVYFERFGYIDNAIAREKELMRDPHHSPALAFTRISAEGV